MVIFYIYQGKHLKLISDISFDVISVATRTFKLPIWKPGMVVHERLRQDVQKFIASLDNLVKLFHKIKIKRTGNIAQW